MAAVERLLQADSHAISPDDAFVDLPVVSGLRQ
jgi:hypothetical protein